MRENCSKGQLILKGLFAILEFFQKTERNNSIIVLLGQKTNLFVCFWKNRQLEKTLLLFFTFSDQEKLFDVVLLENFY